MKLLSSRVDTKRTALGTAFALAFVAGGINAGGFLAVRQYTSHVTGMVSSLADNLALGEFALVVDAAVGVLAFLLGAMSCALLVNFARRRRMASEYALPLMLEALLILLFGLMGARLAAFEGLLVPFTIVLLCFVMGLQNAVVTKLSGGVVRTTHLTGTVTDLGIELGKLLYWNRDREAARLVRAHHNGTCADEQRREDADVDDQHHVARAQHERTHDDLAHDCEGVSELVY